MIWLSLILTTAGALIGWHLERDSYARARRPILAAVIGAYLGLLSAFVLFIMLLASEIWP